MTRFLAIATIAAGCSFGDNNDVTARCGDGVVDVDEGCDDGNQTSSDGCSDTCAVETANPICGNGIRESGEACDDGNTEPNDGCSPRCARETPGTVCGDGTREPGEDCDDGNTVSFDGCSAACVTEPLVTRTLAQTTDSATIVGGLSRVCHHSGTATAENSYYRVFRLSEHGVGGALDIDSVTFGVASAEASVGSQLVSIRIYRYNNPTIGVVLSPADMEQLAITDVQVPNGGPTLVTYPIDAKVPAGATMIVEVFSPDHTPDTNGNGTAFYLGANSAGQTRAGYMRMPTFGCGVTSPQSTDALGFTQTHLLISATGKAY